MYTWQPKHWLTSSNIGLFTTSCKGSSRLRQRVKNLLYCPSANFLFTDISFFNRSCCNKNKSKFKQQTSQTTTYTHWSPPRDTIKSLMPWGNGAFLFVLFSHIFNKSGIATEIGSHANATRPDWVLVNIGSCSGLVPWESVWKYKVHGFRNAHLFDNMNSSFISPCIVKRHETDDRSIVYLIHTEICEWSLMTFHDLSRRNSMISMA